MTQRKPKVFSDARGREWCLHVTLAAILRLKAVGLDVNQLVPQPKAAPEGKQPEPPDLSLAEQLINDESLVFEAVWAVCSPDATAKEITRQDLAGAFDGPAAGSAVEAFFEGLVDFFQNPIRKALTRQILRQIKKAFGLSLERVERAIEAKVDQEMQKADKVLDERLKSFASS